MHPIRSVLFSLVLVAGVRGLPAQVPARVDYTLNVDSAELTGVTVEMRILRAPPNFRVAMAAHTEYDDRYWRYLTELAGESSRGPVRVTREGNSLWRIDSPAGDVTLRYRVRFPESPPMQQASWMAHLTPTGGLIGGPHSFLYVVGGERSPVTVTVHAPTDWRIITGLRTNGGPRTFSASGAEALIDSPMLVGRVRSWEFEIDRIPHEIAYLGRSAGTPFDTALFVGNVQRIARATARMFGRMPYTRFSFLFEDGSYGGLEHVNSVSIGAQSASLARDANGLLGQIAHEFFHIWNEVHLRPEAWIGLRYVAPDPTGELWWSEGVTLYYADLLLRRAGLPTTDSTRVARLERLIGNYLANPSHAAVSAEETSRAFNKPPSATGDYTPNMFLQGDLLGTILDLMILDGSNGRHSLDDAMRTLVSRFSIERGFTGADVERAVRELCACSVGQFFDTYVRRAGSLPFDQWLAAIGLQMSVHWAPALSSDGTLAPDLRVTANPIEGDSAVALKIWFPATALAHAGFHTGDRVESLNGVAIHDLALFRSTLGQLRIGDTLRISVRRASTLIDRTITIAGYERPRVTITARPNATPAQRALFARWVKGG